LGISILYTSFDDVIGDPMSDREAGNKAVEALEKEFDGIVKQKSAFKDKINLMSDAFQKAIGPWNLAGDDRVLSAMRIAAGSAVEEIVQVDVQAVSSEGKLAPKDRIERLKSIRVEVETIPWLADGFKSSLKAEIAFAITDLQFPIGKK